MKRQQETNKKTNMYQTTNQQKAELRCRNGSHTVFYSNKGRKFVLALTKRKWFTLVCGMSRMSCSGWP